MEFHPEPVTLEEYNQTLRDSVNNFYTHSINDSTISKEEAILTTGEIAEDYLNAVEDFQEASQSITEVSTEETSNDLEDGMEL